MATRNFASLYQIKDWMINQVAPKYFSTDEINMASTGLFGYVTETLGILGEDGANMTSMVFKEVFANAAENPESLYLMAAIYQIEDLFATPASMKFVVLLKEDDIINGGKASGEYTVFRLDSATKFSIDDKPFSFDYDVRITSKKSSSGYIHSVQYILDHTNAISDLTSQYIKSLTIQYNGSTYLAFQVNLRQFVTTEYTETVISNDKINVCSFDYTIPATSQLAGFDIFYTAPGSTTEVQMAKKLQNTNKLDTPFCYYTMPDTNKLRIEFANDDRYFTPEFNSTIRVVVYTTLGAAGSFNKYTGTNLTITPVSTKYSEDNGIDILGKVEDASRGGKDKKTQEELRDAVIVAQSTVNAINTTNDLTLFFKKMSNSGNNRIMFMKRRDDCMKRLFNAYLLLSDTDNVVLPTNTCDLIIEEDQVDGEYPETFRAVIKAGKVYTYSDGFAGCLGLDRTIKITDNLDKFEDTKHVYTNPFLTIISSNPAGAGLYLNSVDTGSVGNSLDTGAVNNDSFVQFMVSGLAVKRNALLGDDAYTMTLKVLPTSSTIDECITEVKEDTLVLPTDRVFTSITDGKKYIDRKLIKLVMFVQDGGVETCYREFDLVGYDNSYYIFQTKLTTDDYVSLNSKVKITNSLYDIEKGTLQSEKFIPCSNILANFYTFYKYQVGDNITHEYEKFNIAKGYTLTNKYSSKSFPIDLIIPLSSINTTLIYNKYYDADKNLKYNYKLKSVPMVKANYVKDSTKFAAFVDNFTDIYEYLNGDIDKLTNEFDIDVKFYNTYGKSKNYHVGTDNEALDKVNISINDDIKAYYTTDTEALVTDVKNYIISYVRGDFSTVGNNAIYISNLLRKIESTFPSRVDHQIFKGINSYGPAIQTLESEVTADNISDYYSTMIDYVPEYVNIHYKITNGVSTPEINIGLL